jgi:hypothetical protein
VVGGVGVGCQQVCAVPPHRGELSCMLYRVAFVSFAVVVAAVVHGIQHFVVVFFVVVVSSWSFVSAFREMRYSCSSASASC